MNLDDIIRLLGTRQTAQQIQTLLNSVKNDFSYDVPEVPRLSGVSVPSVPSTPNKAEVLERLYSSLETQRQQEQNKFIDSQIKNVADKSFQFSSRKADSESKSFTEMLVGRDITAVTKSINNVIDRKSKTLNCKRVIKSPASEKVLESGNLEVTVQWICVK